jgi:hypothetical protein
MTGARVPTFFVLGAAKCGTTSLYANFAAHPDVFMSRPKEPLFFESEYERGLEYYHAAYFRGWRREIAAGEARAVNLYLGYVPRRIHAVAPAARLVVILRDPVLRAYSQWWTKYTRGDETLDFAAALDANRRRIETIPVIDGPEGEALWRTHSLRIRTYLDMGYYADQLRRYYELFPREQLRVVLLDDLHADPLAVMRDLYAFIGVAPDAVRRLPPKQNPRVGRWGSRLIALLRHRAPLRLVPRATRERVRFWLNRFGPGRPPIPAALDAELRAHYEPHVAALERLLDRDLSAWRR